MEILTEDDYRIYAGLKRPEVDPKVQQLIKAANAHVIKYLNIETSPISKIQVNRNRDTYFLDAIEATSIASVTRMGSTEPVDMGSYFLQAPGVLVFTTIPIEGWYTVVTDSDPLAVTDDLKTAVYLLVQYWDKNEYRDSRTFGGETVAFTNQNTGMPKHIRTILELYRNI